MAYRCAGITIRYNNYVLQSPLPTFYHPPFPSYVEFLNIPLHVGCQISAGLLLTTAARKFLVSPSQPGEAR
jgi:hypothetical protein